MEKYFCESELGEGKALEKHEGGFCNKEQYGWIAILTGKNLNRHGVLTCGLGGEV